MPGAQPKHPRPACVEDWDDDAQTTISFTRATANVAVKRSSTGLYADPAQFKYNRDGSDSGYSSKAGTIASASTNGKRAPNLSIDTTLPERERQPYAMTPQPRANIRRDSSGRASAAEYVPTPVREKPFRHQPGVCWTCDQYGRHLSNEEHERVIATQIPASPRATTKSSRADDEADAKLRRIPSTREQRSVNMFPPSAIQQYFPPNPMYASSGYNTPITPQMPYGTSPMVFAYATPTPLTSTYIGSPGQVDYFAQKPLKEDRPPNPKRRSSMYGDPVIKQSHKEEAHVPKSVSSKEARPSIKSHKSTRSIDQQRADREAMPPPSERPSQRAEVTRRPSIKKSATYNTAIVDHRRSRGPDDYDYREVLLPARQASPAREARAPPSAYKHIHNESVQGRPRVQRKSVSYSDPVTTTNVVSSRPQESSTNHPRRNTAPTKQYTSHEQQQADAEAYIEHKSRMTSEQLTAEKMAEMKSSKRTVSSRSDTGSNFSHNSHHSSSKASSGRERSHTKGQRTSILIDGGIKLDIPQDHMDRTGRPLSVQIGGLNISVGSKDKSSSASSSGKRDQKLIEKAPSAASHASKKSVTDSSHSSSRCKEKHRDDVERVSRKDSHVSDSRPPISRNGHSQRSSRAPSSTRASVDYGRSRRLSDDHDQSRFMYGA